MAFTGMLGTAASAPGSLLLGAPAPAAAAGAIARRGTPATAAMLVGGTSITVNVPAGVANGDLLLMAVWGGGAASTITDPGGWTLNASPAPSAGRGKVWWRVASSEPASYTITVSSEKYVGLMAAWSGVDGTTPLSASANKNETVAGTGHTSSSLTPGSVNDWVVSLFGDRATVAGSKNTDWVPTGPGSERGEVNNNAAASSPWLALGCNDDGAAVGSVAATTRAATSTGNSTANAFIWVGSLKPAAVTAAALFRRSLYRRAGSRGVN